jgi:hypothetical protein
MLRLRDEEFEQVAKPHRPTNPPAESCSTGAHMAETELGAKLVARLIELGREKLTVNVEAGGLEYRIVRRRNVPVLHERW